MIGRVILLLGFVTALAPACAARNDVGRTTTTSGTLEARPETCAHVETSCIRDDDCCSLWCVGGLCERRQP
jgi:hypothetical protein